MSRYILYVFVLNTTVLGMEVESLVNQCAKVVAKHFDEKKTGYALNILKIKLPYELNKRIARALVSNPHSSKMIQPKQIMEEPPFGIISIIYAGNDKIITASKHAWRIGDLKSGICLNGVGCCYLSGMHIYAIQYRGKTLEVGYTRSSGQPGIDSLNVDIDKLDIHNTENKQYVTKAQISQVLRLNQSIAWDSNIASGNACEIEIQDDQKKKNLILKGHLGLVKALAYCDNNRLASGSDDTTIRIWDSDSGTELKKLSGHTAAIVALAYCKNSSLASSAEDKTIRLWNVETGQWLITLNEQCPVNALAYCDEDRLASTSDNKIKIWDLRSFLDLDLDKIIQTEDSSSSKIAWINYIVKLYNCLPKIS